MQRPATRTLWLTACTSVVVLGLARPPAAAREGSCLRLDGNRVDVWVRPGSGTWTSRTIDGGLGGDVIERTDGLISIGVRFGELDCAGARASVEGTDVLGMTRFVPESFAWAVATPELVVIACYDYASIHVPGYGMLVVIEADLSREVTDEATAEVFEILVDVATAGFAALGDESACEVMQRADTEPSAPVAVATTEAAPPPDAPSPLTSSLAIYAEAARLDDAAALGEPGTLFSGGMRMRSFDPVALEVSGALGGGSGGGFRYDADFLVGYGRRFGGRASLSLMAGVGIGGIADGRLPFTVRLPVQAIAAAQVTSRFHVEAWARGDWGTADRRNGGASSLELFDELTYGVAVILGQQYPVNTRGTGPKLFVAGTVHEVMGARLFAVSIGFGGVMLPAE